jgi:hypothetical protein
MTPLFLEEHHGRAARRKPYDHLMNSGGKTISELTKAYHTANSPRQPLGDMSGFAGGDQNDDNDSGPPLPWRNMMFHSSGSKGDAGDSDDVDDDDHDDDPRLAALGTSLFRSPPALQAVTLPTFQTEPEAKVTHRVVRRVNPPDGATKEIFKYNEDDYGTSYYQEYRKFTPHQSHVFLHGCRLPLIKIIVSHASQTR